MEVVLLGVKEIKSGKTYLYNVEWNRNNQQNKFIEFAFKKNFLLQTVSPYPFENYSSLDEIDETIYEKTLFNVEAKITQEEFDSMKSSGIAYHRFKKRMCRVLSENVEPFQYALDMYKLFGKQLGTYDLTTWVIHQPTRSTSEQLAMEEILTIASKNAKKYDLDLSIDKYIIPYFDKFEELISEGYNLTFGRHGKIEIDDNFEKISNKQLSFLICMERILIRDIIKFNSFTSKRYDLLSDKAKKSFLSCLYDDELKSLRKKGNFDIDNLFKDHLNYQLSDDYFKNYTYFNDDSEEVVYTDIFNFINDENISPYKEHHSPWDYYCCEDCSGYWIGDVYSDEELEGYDLIVDDRLNLLMDLIKNWIPHIEHKSYHLFDKIKTSQLKLFIEELRLNDEDEHVNFFNELIKYRKRQS